ncbi:SH2 domain-containing protein 2A [Lonchura striata]|uniref:SH2 domain-containing protein 2A n=1 Tax=Lonchura striata TaxID=40157 RepID=A0A218UMM8_9PASE|nr:SH2 domain-containing protein 2A [Lonchura striata domestica]
MVQNGPGRPRTVQNGPKRPTTAHNGPEHPRTAQNIQEQSRTAQNSPGQPRTAQNGPEWPRTAQNGPEQPQMAQNGPEWPRTTQNGPEQSRTAQNGPEWPSSGTQSLRRGMVLVYTVPGLNLGSWGHSMDDDRDRPLFITFKPFGFWAPPAAQPPAAGEPWPEQEALRALTRLWFEQTQAQRLGPEGEFPPWFHGFISRREAEELLQDQPLGCFLVRFSESTVGFVLSYRGRERCRHFVLDQLPDGRYVILGERSAHAELAGLLQHHATAPVTPYHEFLTVPLPCGRAPGAPPPSLPAKTGSRGWARGLRSPSGSAAAAPEPSYAQVHKEPARPEPHEAKYQQLMCFHIYAEPREEKITPSPPKPQEPSPEGPIPEEPSPEGPSPEGPIPKGPSPEDSSPEGPIPFYAMARGWSPRTGPEENIYSEVGLARQDAPARLPRAPQNAFSTLPPKAWPHRRLFRSVSSQDGERRQLAAAPSRERKGAGASSTGTQAAASPEPELDDPVYSSTARDVAENVYEQLPGHCP